MSETSETPTVRHSTATAPVAAEAAAAYRAPRVFQLAAWVAIVAGIAVVRQLIAARIDPFWTRWFLIFAIATSVTGYFFARDHILPSHVVGAVSLVVLAITVYALYARRLAGSWRGIYVAGSVLALWLNAFVLVIQSFLKIPALAALAPTQSEMPFVVAQAAVLLILAALGYRALRAFRAPPGDVAARPA